MRKYLKRVLIGFLISLLIAAIGFFIWVSDKYVVPIMAYHHIDYASEPKNDTVRPEVFKKHMAYLKAHNYNVIRLSELIEAIKQGRKLPEKSVVITFDDGYQDNYFSAYPVLKEYQFPSIIFIISDVIGTQDFLTLPQIREMSENGVDIGSHTKGHPYLPGLSEQAQQEEIAGSKKVLEERLGRPIDYLCYPSGGFTDKIKELAKEAGYQGACTTNRGFNRFNQDAFEIKRIRFKNTDNNFILWLKLSGYYNLFRKTKPAH